MTRFSRTTSTLILFGVALSLCLAAGCGGASAKSGDIEPGTGGANAGLPKDEQAESARGFCEHDVKAAELQPPDALSRKQIMACITALRPQIKNDCAKNAPRDITLKIIIDKSGKVTEAFPIGDGADSPEASCAAGIVKTAVFPAFKGALQQVIQKYPLSVGK